MSKGVDWYYMRKGWTTCTKATKFLEANDISIKETVLASKKLQADDGRDLITTKRQLIAMKGKKVMEFDRGDASDDAVAAMLGPTGNLRAPTIVVGNTVLVGYNDEIFEKVFNGWMTEKAPMALALLDSDTATPLIQAYFEICHLKQLFRKGWLQRGMQPLHCETVAEHSFGNAMLCLMLLPNEPELDGFKVLRLALLHDIGEAYVGDITPQDRVEKSEKTRRETEAVEQILAKLPDGGRWIADWHEYEEQSSAEAKFVKQIDRLELALQASVYEHQGRVDADEFIAAAERHADSDAIASELATLRLLQQSGRHRKGA